MASKAGIEDSICEHIGESGIQFITRVLGIVMRRNHRKNTAQSRENEHNQGRPVWPQTEAGRKCGVWGEYSRKQKGTLRALAGLECMVNTEGRV